MDPALKESHRARAHALLDDPGRDRLVRKPPFMEEGDRIR
jgi:deoxyribodipyrimidine photolyase-related protein